jgi:hypothetical protein
MKVYSIILLFLFSSISCSQTEIKNHSKSDSLLIKQIKKEKPNNFIGKTLNEYLSNKILKKYINWWVVDEPPGKLSSIILIYSEKVWVEIAFSEMLHQRKFNENREWDFNALKKEKIYKIHFSWDE